MLGRDIQIIGLYLIHLVIRYQCIPIWVGLMTKNLTPQFQLEIKRIQCLNGKANLIYII